MKFVKYFNTVNILTNRISSQYLVLKDLNDYLSLPKMYLFTLCFLYIHFLTTSKCYFFFPSLLII